MTAVWERPDISSTQKLVLLALADWANDEGLCWPSLDKLCTKSSLGRRTIQMAIKDLCAAGLLVQEHVSGKGCRYWIKVGVQEMHGCRSRTGGVQEMHGGGAGDAPNTLFNHQLTTIDEAPSGEDAPVSPDEIVDYWNAIAERHGLAKVFRLTSARRQRLQSRIKEFPDVDTWATAFENISKSDFLRGDNDRGWKANFDFLLQTSSFVKLIEGVYNGK